MHVYRASLICQHRSATLIFVIHSQAETMATRSGVDGAVLWSSDVPHCPQRELETAPMEWYGTHPGRHRSGAATDFCSPPTIDLLKPYLKVWERQSRRVAPFVLLCVVSLSRRRQGSYRREGRVQPDHQLWPPAPGGSWRAAFSPGAQRRVRQEM